MRVNITRIAGCFLATIMIVSLCACANKGESNSAFDEAKSEVQNAENEASTEEVTEVSTVPADPEMADISARDCG